LQGGALATAEGLEGLQLRRGDREGHLAAAIGRGCWPGAIAGELQGLQARECLDPVALEDALP
jgi:hypothetical protein